MMKMYFHFGYEGQFMFEQLKIDSPIKLWGFCFIIFLASVLFEFIKYIRCVHCGCSTAKSNCNIDGGDISDNNDTNTRLARNNCYVSRLRSRRHRCIQTVLHTAQTALGFVIMLSVMSFNICIIFAILVGKCSTTGSNTIKRKIKHLRLDTVT